MKIRDIVLLVLCTLCPRLFAQQWEPITKMELVPPANQTGFERRDNSDLWRASKPGNHHFAALRVSCDQTNAAGSGVNVAVDGGGAVVLNCK